MSYIYLQEQGEVSSAECFSDIPASALSKSKSIQEKCYSNDNETESCRDSRSGMTCKPSTGSRGEGKSMSSVVDSHAKTSQQQDRVQELKELEVAYGARWHASFAKFDPDTHSWKTAQCSLLGGLELFSETWPRWGIMRNGECWALDVLGDATTAREYGCWLTTPTCTNMKGTIPSKKFSEGRLPAPSQLAKDAGGKPCPKWGEWLMAWPIGWTGLEPLETGRFQEWLQMHSKFFQDEQKGGQK